MTHHSVGRTWSDVLLDRAARRRADDRGLQARRRRSRKLTLESLEPRVMLTTEILDHPDLSLGPNDRTLIEIGGPLAGHSQGGNDENGYDRINVSGLAQLAGTLDVEFVNGFVPQVGQTFDILTFGSVAGSFTTALGLYETGDPAVFLRLVQMDDRLRLETFQAVVVQLTAGDDAVSLSQSSPGTLTLSGSVNSTVSLPAGALIIDGLGGHNALSFASNVDFGATDVVIKTESITLGSGKTVSGSGDLVFWAVDGDSGEVGLFGGVADRTAGIVVNGTLHTTGDVNLHAQAARNVSIDMPIVQTFLADTAATVTIGSGAEISGQSVRINALTSGDVSLSADMTLGISIAKIDTEDRARISIGAATLNSTAEGGVYVSAATTTAYRTAGMFAFNDVTGGAAVTVNGADISAGANGLRLLATEAFTLTANAPGGDSSGDDLPEFKLVGGAISLNVLEGGASVTVQDATLAAGALGVEISAQRSSLLEVTIAGVATSMESSGGTPSLAVNGMIVSNVVLGDAIATVTGGEITTTDGGALRVLAENASTIKATINGAVASDDLAVGFVVAVNTIGWEAQNILSQGLDALIGSDALGQEQPATVRAQMEGTQLEIDGDLIISAISVPQLTAAIDSSVVSSAAAVAAGFVLASNLVSSQAEAILKPNLGDVTFSVGGNLEVSASDTAGIAASINMSGASSGGKALGGMVVRNDVRNGVQALVEEANLEVAGDVTIQARGSATITASLSGGQPSSEATDAEDNTAAPGASFALTGLIATNLILSEVTTSVLNSNLTAGGDLTIDAHDSAIITAENSAVAQAAGAAVGMALAFNTIGWESQNVLFNAVDALLGTSIGDEQPVIVQATVVGSHLIAGGDLTINAQTEEKAEATLDNEATSTGASAGASLVLASNLVSARARAYVAAAVGQASLAPLDAGGQISVTAQDAAGIEATVTMVAGSGGGVAVGGLAVRNDVRSDVAAEADRVDLHAGGNFVVQALESASISATLSGETKSEASEEDPGAGKPGGTTLAFNGLIANNLVLSAAHALVSDSTLLVEGDLQVLADNVATITAENTAVMESSGTAVGVTLAFNSIGWKSQNILFGAIDALLGTSIGDEQPAAVSARLTGTTFFVAGDVRVAAGAIDDDPLAAQGSSIQATISNTATSSGGSMSLNFVLASNKVSSESRASIDSLVTVDLVAGGSLDVTATDAAAIDSEVTLSTSSAGSAAVGGVAVTNDVRSLVQAGLDQVHLQAGNDVAVQSLESATLSATLSGDSQSPADDSGGGVSTSSPLAANGLIANNLVLSSSQATLTNSDVTAGGSVTVHAENNSEIVAENTATMTSGGTAVGVTLAFNTIGWKAQNIFSKTIDALLGTNLGTEQAASVLAKIEHSQLDVQGDLEVTGLNTATVSATTSNQASSKAAGAAASVVLASNMVSTTANAYILQAADSGAAPIVGGGDLLVQSTDTPTILANNQVQATSSKNDDVPAEYMKVDFYSGSGEQAIEFGTMVFVDQDHEAGGVSGHIYRYMGGEAVTLDLSTVDYADNGYWQEILPPEGFVADTLSFLYGAMPHLEKEVVLASIPIGGSNYDIGFKVGAGWDDLTVLDFINGQGDKEAGFSLTDNGVRLGVGELLGRAGPELTLDLNFPNPQLPELTYQQVVDTIDYGGQTFNWGIEISFGWHNVKLLDFARALIGGQFADLLPTINYSVFVDPFEADGLQFLPQEIAAFLARYPDVQVHL
ncbi:MAG: hypothetical protein NTY19_05100, partial [Planctomycetota bacterium]|nr:hypothetical protein [Planctomycetota bacterium]